MNELRFDGKVAIVTGSGRNLGRSTHCCSRRVAARIVVNDLGVGISDTDGRVDAPAQNPAHDVVDEIRAAGGEAIANTDTVATHEGGTAIVQSALDAFGAVDIVVNNVGQVRMAPFATFPDDLIDPVIDTQLRGVLNVGRPAWKFMAEHGGGRFVNVASGAAFGGVPGGAVYGMAKMGVIGLTRAMASEGRADAIAANVIVPSAKTRARHRLRADPLERRARRVVAPASRRAARGLARASRLPALGRVSLDVGGGHFARVGLVTNDGILDRDATIETLAGARRRAHRRPDHPDGERRRRDGRDLPRLSRAEQCESAHAGLRYWTGVSASSPPRRSSDGVAEPSDSSSCFDEQEVAVAAGSRGRRPCPPWRWCAACTTRCAPSLAQNLATATCSVAGMPAVEPPRRLPGGEPHRLGVDVRVGGALADRLERTRSDARTARASWCSWR